eukprot:gene2797-biopygen2305
MEPVDGIDHQPGPSRPPKARRLSNLDVADVIITKPSQTKWDCQTLHLAAPKTTYAKDILFDKDTPIFATGKEAIKFKGKYNTTDERENEMNVSSVENL